MADLQQRRRRSAAGDRAEEEALAQLEMELQVQDPLPALKDETEIPDEEPEGKTTVMVQPVETPRALVPVKPLEAPLFSPAQVAQMEAFQSTAAHLYGGPKVLQGLPQGSDGPTAAQEVPRPKFLEDERLREMALQSTATGSPSPVDFAALMGRPEDGGPMLQMLLGLYQENQKLKQEALRGSEIGPGPRALENGALPGGAELRGGHEGLHGGAELPGGAERHRGRAEPPDGREGLRDRAEHRDGAGLPGGHGHASKAREMLTPYKVGATEPEFEKPRDGLVRERQDLYSLTPMEQFAKLQEMMTKATGDHGQPRPGRDGDRGRSTRNTTSRDRGGARSGSKDRTFSGIPMPKVGRQAAPPQPAGASHAGSTIPRTQEERMQHQMDVMTKMMMHSRGEEGLPRGEHGAGEARDFDFDYLGRAWRDGSNRLLGLADDDRASDAEPVGWLARLVEPHPDAEPAVVPGVHEAEAIAEDYLRGHAGRGASEEQVGSGGAEGGHHDDGGSTAVDPGGVGGHEELDTVEDCHEAHDDLPAGRRAGEDCHLEAVGGSRGGRNDFFWGGAATEVVAVASASSGCRAEPSRCFDPDAGSNEAHEEDLGGQCGAEL